MYIISEFFKTNIVIVDFVYPLVFFLMGFGIFLKNTVHSRFYLARSLQYLAMFGILHGIADWGHVFIPIQKSYLNSTIIFILESLMQIVNAISFFFIFYFGIHLFVQTKKLRRQLLLIPVFVIIIWVSHFILLEPFLVDNHNQDWWFAISDIWARYLLAFPGTVVSCYALFLQREQFQDFGVPSMTRALLLAAGFVGLYGVTGGLIVPYAPVIPAILFNSDLFFYTTGIPVQIFRALSGFFMAFFILKILKVFDLEYQHYVHESESQKAVMEERNKIARDLHDDMIQSIFATGLQLERIRHLLEDKSEGMIQQSLNELHIAVKRLNDIIREIRGYIKKLRMDDDQPISLRKELKKLMEDISSNPLLAIDLDYSYSGREPSLSKTIQIYYIVKEALSNILRHANATHAMITVKGDDNKLMIEVSDNGRGFIEINTYSNSEEDLYLQQGIRNMHARAQSIGGTLTITSGKGKGTLVSLQVIQGEEKLG